MGMRHTIEEEVVNECTKIVFSEYFMGVEHMNSEVTAMCAWSVQAQARRGYIMKQEIHCDIPHLKNY